MSNKELGNKFENELAELLDEKGFWVHLLNQNKSGQPADMIAAMNRHAHLIDAKVCQNNTFPLSRIEENQHLAMEKWQQCGNGWGWFALKVDSGIYMLGYKTLKYLSKYHSVLSKDTIIEHGTELDLWIRLMK